MGTCICMAESLRCRPETVTTLFVNWLYLNTILKVKKKKKQHWRVFTVSRPHCVCPHSRCVCFPCHHCLGSRLLCRELSEAGPGLYALPRSKPLRFRYLGSPQRCRLGWACVLCPSQVRAAQVMRCLATVVAETYRLPCPCCSVFWVYNWRTFSGGC